jgi:hypothetical protein
MDQEEVNSDVNESQKDTESSAAGTPYATEPAPDVYPLRAPSEDPRWALWVIGIWLAISIGLFLFFIVLAVLGIWYD